MKKMPAADIGTITDTSFDFEHVDCWVFDLDNTLYPASCDLFAQIDQRMGAFIAEFLNVDLAAAKQLQKEYYRDHGTTMNGLMICHGMDPQRFLDHVHDIDLAPVAANPALARSIAALPGRKYVLTNASRTHAHNVMDRLGVSAHFDDVFDIHDAGYTPKPAKAPYISLFERTGGNPKRSAMFEDLARNLEVPHALGMTTIYIDGGPRHPDARLFETPVRQAHIHHITDDLLGFLGDLTGRLGRPVQA